MSDAATLEECSEATRAAIAREVGAAAALLRQDAREMHPDAIRLHLIDSDQGDWLECDKWENQAGERHEFDDRHGCAAHLYDAYLTRIPGLRRVGNGSYTFDLARIEVVAVRDPDGGVEIDVLIDGTRSTADVYTVDAAAGWAWEDWENHRQECTRGATPLARELLGTAFANPPGAQYIEGFEGGPSSG